ncbi:hypothetical protein M422DRAFT_267364 [Sphaerobolus stellatus SS14]|uniref:Uncharacterized protein n=1 Tax=Sphaerobolus stellatus (strain SS14) TaxID=990650 RepID=A0A0C9U981_SPHS4|nr:hypothetical protein M422DRAFT_267364 [Sphaerobolus stellatus SS14]
MSLMKADYNLKVFKKHAAHYRVDLPRAFFGSLVINSSDEVDSSYGITGRRSMFYDAFLTTPLLDITG